MEEERAIHAASSTREENQRHARLHWLRGGRRQRRDVPYTMQHLPQDRGETATCEMALVGRGQETEEGRFFIIVATIILSDLN